MNFKKPEQPKLAQHDSSVLDLAFVMDCTGSMSSYINSARDNIRMIVEEIVASEKSDIKLALVEYRDHPPQDTTFITRKHDFTTSVQEMRNWLDDCSAQGGGDTPEAVADGLNDALHLDWRDEATKICVLVSDAPPHGLSENGDKFPKGCPLGIDPLKVVRHMGEKGITLYCVGCEPALVPYRDFFIALAYMTGGQYVPLKDAKLLAKVIIGSAQEEISLEKLMGDIQMEVNKLVENSDGKIDKEALKFAVHENLKKQGATAKKLFQPKNLKKSEKSKMFSEMSCLSEVKKEFLSETKKATTEVKSLDEDVAESLSAEAYKVESDLVDEEQAERLVQKALNRKNKK